MYIMFNFDFKILEFIQKFRTPILDEFFKFLNFFDTDLFYFILIPMIWIGYNRKLGIKLFFVLILSIIVNYSLKNLFMLPRPCQINPSFEIIKFKSYSFPSGAAQNAILIPLIFINHFKNKKWPIFIGSFYFLLISFSRMYLGAHFLSDLLGGWIVGVLLFLIYRYLFPKIEKHVSKNPVFSFWVYQLIILFFLFIPRYTRYVFAILGIFLGLFLSWEFNIYLENTKTLKKFLLRSSLAILGILFLYFSFYFLNKKIPFFDLNVTSYLMGFWISFLCPYIYLKFIFKKPYKI